jgi:DnaK suppressor protein
MVRAAPTHIGSQVVHDWPAPYNTFMTDDGKGTAIDVAALRARLVALQEDIKAQVEASADARKTVELDQSSVGRLSRMDALQGQAMAMAALRRRQDQLIRIGTALQRIADGEYGYCASCGEPIGAARLELDPTVAACINCAMTRG